VQCRKTTQTIVSMQHAFRLQCSTCRISGWYRPVVSSINIDRVRDRRGIVARICHVTIVVTKVLLLLLLIKMTTCRVSLDIIAAVHLCDFVRRCVYEVSLI